MCQYTSARPMNILGAFYPTLSWSRELSQC
jgi:hypothetical protein